MSKDKPDSFEQLVRPEMPGLFRAAYRLTGNRADAEDLVQDTCISANGHLDEISACTYPDRWLLRVLFNRFVDGARKRDRSPVVILDDAKELHEMASEADNPEFLASQRDAEDAFAAAWRDLELTQRALLSLRAEGYGLVEIAEISGVAKDVLGPRLHRARQSLKRNLERRKESESAVRRLGRGR